MKRLILPLFSMVAYAATAQLSVVPQVGIQSFRTTIKQNDLSSFSPLGQRFAPGAAVRVAYTLKSGQGAFLGVATSSQAIDLKFTDPQQAYTSYTAAAKNLQLRLEGGYQFTSKPITLKKGSPKNDLANKYTQRSSGERHGGCMRSMCGGMRHSQGTNSNASLRTLVQDKGLYMRIKPSVGLAFSPSGNAIETEMKGGQTTYAYRAGWTTAVIAGTAFEFGTRNQPKLILTLSYLNGLGNNTTTVTNSESLKPIATTFSSKTSGFNIGLGIPLSFKKNVPVIQKPQFNQSPYHGHCQRYRMYQM